jgi:hypothetical protein
MASTLQQRLGQQGEDRALAHLQQQGLRLLERNFRCKLGELDLIMQHGAALVFVEVRQRASARYGGGGRQRHPGQAAPAAARSPVLSATLCRTAAMPLRSARHRRGKLVLMQNVLEM